MLHKNKTAKTTVFAAIRAAVIGTAAVIVLAAVLSACKHKSGGGGSTPVPAYAVTFGVEGSHGTLTAKVDGTAINSGSKVKKGDTLLFTAEPAEDYAVDKRTVSPASALSEGGTEESKSANIKVTEPIDVKVRFKYLYIPVAYSELETYLANTAFADKVNYIEVTGPIPPADFKNEDGSDTSAFGQKIQAHPAKKVALKLPGEVAGLDSMLLCFAGCTNLVSLADIPASIKDMAGVFSRLHKFNSKPRHSFRSYEYGLAFCQLLKFNSSSRYSCKR